MLNKTRQNISIKESLLFCVLGGFFVYFVASIPYILFYLYPPTQPENSKVYICFATPPIPNKYSFILGLSLFSIVGIFLLRKINFRKRLSHFSLLVLFLSVGGGILTSLLKAIYYIFLIGDSGNQEYFFARLRESYFETFIYDVQIIGWAIIFLIAFIPFTLLFLLTTSLIQKYKFRNSLK